MLTLLRTSLITLLLCFLGLKTFAASGPVIFNVDVPGGQWKRVRIKNLPKDAVVAVQVESSGDILLAFVDAKDYQAPSDKRRILFMGRVEKRLSFSVTTQESGDHYLLFDNRTGNEIREVSVAVRAARGTVDQMQMANKILRVFELKLHQIFEFDTFPIGIKQCDAPKVFVDNTGLILCAEYIYYLYDVIEDQEKTKDALSFSIFHEIARVLLYKWDHPFASNEEVADEFATVLMVMVNQEERAKEAAAYFMENPTSTVVLKKLFDNKRHPLTVKRGTNVLRWLDDPRLIANWQKTLVPHMQTSFLEWLRLRPTPWTDLPLVEQEIAKRGKKTN